MGAVNTTYTFTATDTITSTKMNNIIDETVMTSDAVLGGSGGSGGLDIASGKLSISANAINSSRLATNSVTTDAITNLNVTTAKIADANVTSAKLEPNITVTSLTAGGVTSTGALLAGSGMGAGDANVLIGYNRTASGTANVFFYSDAGTNIDASIQRTSGTNGALQINNEGTGNFHNTGSTRYGYNTASPTNTHHFVGGIRNTSPNAAGTGSYLVIDASGDIKALGSSLRYKNSIEDYNKGLKELKQLRPVTYKFNGEDVVTAGFIAEEVDAIGMDEYVIKNSEGQPDALNYGQMVALLVNSIKEQQQQIDELKAKVQ